MPHTAVPQRRALPEQQQFQQQPQQQQYDPNEFKGAEAPHIPHEAIETTEQLGEGEFGSVLKGIRFLKVFNPSSEFGVLL